MSTSTLNRVKYAGLDWNTHLDDLRSKIQLQYATDFNDFAVSGQGMMLLDAVAYGLDSLSFYLDRRATDLYLSTARTRRSVAKLARQLGYKMGAAVASSVDLTVSVDNPQSFPIPVPKGFQFQGPDGLIFESSEEVTFPAGSSDSARIPTYQGETITESFVGDGEANQVYELARVPDDSFVVSGTVKVTVDGDSAVEKEFLDFDGGLQFEVGYNDDPPTVNFGDGTTGTIPGNGESIVVTYVASRGKAGLVDQGSINDVVRTLVVGFTNIDLTVTNPNGSIGGDDPEDIEHAKAYAPKVFKSRKSAVTREDYEALSGSFADSLFGRVAVAQAISSRSASNDLYLRSRISAIRGYATLPVPVVQASVTSGKATLDDVLSYTAVVTSSLADIGTQTNSILNTYASQIRSSANQAKNLTAIVDLDADDIKSIVTTLDGLIDASGASAGEKSGMKAQTALITTEATTIQSTSSSIRTQEDSTLSAVGNLEDGVELIGTSVSAGYLKSANDANNLVISDVGVSSPASGLYLVFDDIEAAVVDTSTGIDSELDLIYDHADRLLAADSKANLVTVPILARDSAGFYATPSVGLIRSLQEYLDERREVTHTVAVVSGGDYLIPAAIEILIGVGPNTSQSVSETSTAVAVDSLLKNRSFGRSLYVSDVVDAILEVSGILTVNVTITGYYPPSTPTVLDTTKLDENGNLIIEDSEVITKGLVGVTSIVRTRTKQFAS